jgi:hypothetical protein
LVFFIAAVLPNSRAGSSPALGTNNGNGFGHIDRLRIRGKTVRHFAGLSSKKLARSRHSLTDLSGAAPDCDLDDQGE